MINEDSIQLLWQTWNHVCEFIGPFKNGTKGVYIDDNSNIIGLYYNNNYEDLTIKQGDWILKNYLGEISFETNSQRERRLKIYSIFDGLN